MTVRSFPHVPKGDRCIRCARPATRVTMLRSVPATYAEGTPTTWAERHCDDHAPTPNLNCRIVSSRPLAAAS